MATAIFVAEVQEFCKTLGFDSIQYFSLSDPANFAPWVPALIAVDGERLTVRAQYYVYLMYGSRCGSCNPRVETAASWHPVQ